MSCVQTDLTGGCPLFSTCPIYDSFECCGVVRKHYSLIEFGVGAFRRGRRVGGRAKVNFCVLQHRLYENPSVDVLCGSFANVVSCKRYGEFASDVERKWFLPQREPSSLVYFNRDSGKANRALHREELKEVDDCDGYRNIECRMWHVEFGVRHGTPVRLTFKP